MLARFLSSFPPDDAIAREGRVAIWNPRLEEIQGFLEITEALGFGGHGGGRIFLLDRERGEEALELVQMAFPRRSSGAVPFARDWLGRIFATDFNRVVDNEPQVKLFELTHNKVLDVDESVKSFFSRGLVDEPDLYLEQDLYEQWRGAGGGVLAPSECASFKLPIFLGGEFSPENIEVSDLSVFWYTTGQVIDLTRNLPPGTSIGGFSIS